MQNFLDRNAWIEIDLTAISRNILEIKKYLRSDTDIMAVVKANAYGHGITEVAKKSIESNVKILGVAMLDEAELLRKNGIRSEILVMGNALQRESPRIVNLDISQVVSNIEIVRSLSKEARIQKKNAKIHIKIDTGMGRVGIGYIEAVKFIKKIIKLQNIEIQGLMTHFSTADEPDGLDYAYRQLNRFTSVINALKEIGLEIKWRHAANSAGIALIHESHLNLVRPGLLIYGITPTPSPCKIFLTPALTLKARLTQIKRIGVGESISYGRTFITQRKSKVGIVPLGYGDGFSRKHSNQGKVIVDNRYAPIIGRICMDQFVVDLTDIPNARLGEEVVLIGKQSGIEITVWDLAKVMETVPHEVLSVLNSRIPRYYFDT